MRLNNNLKQLSEVIEQYYDKGFPFSKERKDSREPSIAQVIQQDLKIHKATYYRRLARLEKTGWVAPWHRNIEPVEQPFTSPELESEDMDTQELVEHVTKRFLKRQKAAQEKKWIPLQFSVDGPVGVCFMGDPHVDDNGCNWVKLRHDLDTINNTEGMFAASLGDASNNWVGRLSRLWASQETSARQSWQLVQWLLEETDWCLLVKGNHDMWLPNDVDPIEWLKVPGTLTQDWQARIEFKFPKGRSGRVWAAHDMPGHSQWNPLHAQQKRAKFTQEADLYISGHRHHWALAQNEDDWSNKIYWTARAKGYKTEDSYADRLGHGQQQYGEAITAIFDPLCEEETGFLTCFPNVQEAAEYLTFKRAKRA